MGLSDCLIKCFKIDRVENLKYLEIIIDQELNCKGTITLENKL